MATAPTVPNRQEQQRSSRRRSPTAANRVLALLQSRPIARSASELTETLGVHKETVSAALKNLHKRGLVVKVGTSSNTRYRASGAAPVAPTAPSLRGDRPRLLGLRTAWLKEQGHRTAAPGENPEPDAPRSAEAAS